MPTSPAPTAVPTSAPVPAGAVASRPLLDAALVMQSSGYAPAVRSGPLADSWSRLYQAGAWFVDLMLRPDASGALLQGQLLADGAGSPAGARVVLERAGSEPLQVAVDAQGGFDLRLREPGSYRLAVALDEATVALPAIDIG